MQSWNDLGYFVETDEQFVVFLKESDKNESDPTWLLADEID